MNPTMNRYLSIFIAVGLLSLAACTSGKNEFDATGVFEADEVIVAAENAGRILQFDAKEGDSLAKDQVTVLIDPVGLELQKAQVDASMQALQEKTMDVRPQIKLLEEQLAVQQAQFNTLEKEKQRFSKLVQADAAPQKQLDDLLAQIDVLRQQQAVTKQQIAVQQQITGTQNRSILSEQKPLEKRAAQLQDQLARTQVKNPLAGILLTKYALAGEMTAPGKALYKVANLNTLTLRAYVSGAQLPTIRLNQALKVMTDNGKGGYETHQGVITWISDKAEFTPKTIQTKDERANLVYAIKVQVKNNGYLKIGMYGECQF